MSAKETEPIRMQKATLIQKFRGASSRRILPPLLRGMMPVLRLKKASSQGTRMKNWNGLRKNCTRNLRPNFKAAIATGIGAAMTNHAKCRTPIVDPFGEFGSRNERAPPS